MNETRLDNIPFELDVGHLARGLHIEGQAHYIDRLAHLADAARAIARPRAMYRVAYIESKSEDEVVVDGVRFTSRVLRVNLDEAHRVFPFVATCGTELEAWARPIDDMLERYWAGAIMEAVLRAAIRGLNEHIEQHVRPGRTATMNPGSLKDWPIEQQRELFRLLGDPRGAIGVELTDSFLMVPIKSVSGLRFPLEVAYENCQLCPRDPCPGRRAPYDPDLYGSRYSRART
jgi:hypothetical protein